MRGTRIAGAAIAVPAFFLRGSFACGALSIQLLNTVTLLNTGRIQGPSATVHHQDWP